MRRCSDVMKSAGITLVRGYLRGSAKTIRLSRATMRKIFPWWRGCFTRSSACWLAHIKRRLFSHWARPDLTLVYGFIRIAGRASGPTASGPNRPL